MPGAASPPALITLILLTAISTLSLNMFLPSLAGIAADLDASYAAVSLAVGGYLAVTAVVQLIAGPLSDRVGRRPVLTGALLVFTAASAGCALAEDIRAFLAFRMLQGGIVSGYTLSLAIVRDTAPERKAAGLIGYISTAMAVAPMLGPVLGGVLDAVFGWRANFYFYAVSGLLLLLWCRVGLAETHPGQSAPADANPDRMAALIREPQFWAFSLCGAFSTGAFYIFLTGAPLAAQSQFAIPAAGLGVCIGTITAGFMLGSFIAGRLAPHCQPAAMMLAGRLVACTGLAAGVCAGLAGALPPLLFFGAAVFTGFGNGLTMPSCNAAAMSVRPGLAGSAAGLNGALTVACGAVLTALAGMILPEEEPAAVLLLMMLAASGAGLVAALAAFRRGRRLPEPDAG
ncbi:MFS transporter [Leisingera sp. ANG-M1]|uniref:multidrug effflux MFS transporter n=1 Tax=Leisingera sp. ANG-M1 TaxID=1577895 RepID=UPI00057E6D56|nr:multidrug effflux MFS transporter [Leisingera sp. ANG-M1]KIC11208.1 MFS transporter [Leisingera sp. ANG-M1]